jgi:imidazolonepropionase-like amidohydrolase
VFLPDAIVRSRRVLTTRGVRPASIHIRQGRIIGVVAFDDVPPGCPVDDVADAAILPTPIDVGAGEYRSPAPLVSVSSAESLNSLFQARRGGARLTAVASIKSLCAVTNDQERRDREFLWAALANGLIQFVSAEPARQLDLAGLWKEASARGYSMDQLASWTASMPAQVMGLARKGKIDVGFDADLVALADESVVRVYARGERIS